MSVAEYLRFQTTFRSRMAELQAFASECPTCWAVVANPVHARFEREDLVAIFDTAEAARAYIAEARLPAVVTEEGYVRSFRRDTLLWNYNPNRAMTFDQGSMVVEINDPLAVTAGTPFNPPAGFPSSVVEAVGG